MSIISKQVDCSLMSHVNFTKRKSDMVVSVDIFYLDVSNVGPAHKSNYVVD